MSHDVRWQHYLNFFFQLLLTSKLQHPSLTAWQGKVKKVRTMLLVSSKRRSVGDCHCAPLYNVVQGPGSFRSSLLMLTGLFPVVVVFGPSKTPHGLLQLGSSSISKQSQASKSLFVSYHLSSISVLPSPSHEEGHTKAQKDETGRGQHQRHPCAVAPMSRRRGGFD